MIHTIKVTEQITASIQRQGNGFKVELSHDNNKPFLTDLFKGSESLSTVVKWCEYQAEIFNATNN